MSNEVILEPQQGFGPCTHIRGSLIINARRLLEARGEPDAYHERVPAEHQTTFREVTVGEWVPEEIGHIHYGIMSELIPSEEEQTQAGHQSAAKLQATYIKTLFKAMRVAGAVTPDRALTVTHKVLARVLQGANARIVRAGQKDARIECFGVPFCRHSYFRHSWKGWWETSLSLTAHKVFVRIVRHDHDSIVYLASWV